MAKLIAPVPNVVLIIIGVTIVLVLLVALFAAVFNFLGQTRCPNGYIASNQKTLTVRTDGYYNVVEEICHDPAACNNPTAPCVYNTVRGTSCPASANYTGSRLTANDVCISSTICPNWTADVGFTDQGLSLQQTTDPLEITTCGLHQDNLVRIWPSNCIRGVIGYNESDQLWYCLEAVLHCDANQVLVRGYDGNFRCVDNLLFR